MGAIQSSINQVLGTVAGAAAIAKHASQQSEATELAARQNKVAILEAEKEYQAANDALGKDTTEKMDMALEGKTDDELKKYIDPETGEAKPGARDQLVDDDLVRRRDNALNNQMGLFSKKQQFENLSPEDRLKLFMSDDATKEHFQQQYEQTNRELEAAKKANITLNNKITARRNLKFNKEIAQKKLAALRGAKR